MMTLTQLEYIVAVEKFGNFRAAAKSCFVTQPTLSMQIQKMEEDLGVILFDRSSKPIKATPIGQKILDQSRVVLAQSALIHELIQQEKKSIEGDLRLGVIPTLAPYLLPLFLDNFASQYPRVRLFVEESKTDDMIVALQKNQLDIGLAVTPLDEPLLVEHPLFHEPFYVYASKKSELAGLKEVQEKDLKERELLLLTEGHCMREQVLRVCKHREGKRETFSQQLQFESGSIETLCHLVEKGRGYTVIPHLAKVWRNDLSGDVIPFKKPSPSREVSLIVHRSFVRDSLLKALSDCIRSSLPGELQKDDPSMRTIAIHDR